MTFKKGNKAAKKPGTAVTRRVRLPEGLTDEQLEAIRKMSPTELGQAIAGQGKIEKEARELIRLMSKFPDWGDPLTQLLVHTQLILLARALGE